MYMSKEKFEEIKRRYSTLLILDCDAVDAFNFVNEILEAEAEATEAKEPSATASIRRLKEAAYEVFAAGQEIESEF